MIGREPDLTFIIDMDPAMGLRARRRAAGGGDAVRGDGPGVPDPLRDRAFWTLAARVTGARSG